ncbi:hypothetical protein SHKM778_22560 [Streptomyces sp. KM77-8]|uniref:Uncharacterized protein n=1 Tax=Streptomyces haneummycinicus TaxID=3074435 RepID=A0AAT9HEW7_9ACTN
MAGEFGSFPIVLEAVRECLQDVFDVPGLVELMGDLEARKVRLVEVTTPEPSPFARSLLFGYVAQFLYEGDSPLAERRAAALSLDSRLLAELLGRAELRELLDAEVLAELESELRWLTEDRRVKDAEGVADLLRMLGPLTDEELAERGAEPRWARELASARRAIQVRVAGADHWAAIEDAGRLRDALGTALPVGVPEAFTEPVKDPSETSSRATRARTARSLRRPRRRVSDWAWQSPRVPCNGCRRRAGSSRASSIRPVSARSGATRPYCAGCAAAPWPRCGTNSSRCRRPPSPSSCPSGSTSARGTPCAASTAWCGRSSNCRARPYPRPPWRGWSCRPG